MRTKALSGDLTMGKVRVKTFGDEDQEQQEKEKRKSEREQKLSRAKSASGGKLVQTPSEGIPTEQKPATTDATAKKSVVARKTKSRQRSKSYLEAAALVERKNKYSVSEALDLIEKLKRTKFDETVELHVNTVRTGQFGNVMLPHGTGKKTRVAIADDALIAQIEKGKIDFDILLAEPEIMPKLAKVARVLGPRGLMPNPKNGTIAKNPKEAAKHFEAGQLTIKTEGKFPVVHLAVGKASFGKEKLGENIEAVLDTIKAQNIQAATLKSTMSPGVKIQIS